MQYMACSISACFGGCFIRSVFHRYIAFCLVLTCTSFLLISCSEEEDDGSARAEQFNKDMAKMWQRLSVYQDTYLKRWKPVFEAGGAVKPVDVIDAFNMLAYQMTGPDGFWRKEVPIVWLRCRDNPDSPGCSKLKENDGVFSELDAFQEKIARTEPMRAGSFLLANLDKMSEYLDTYVLPTPNRSGMKATKYFQTNLNTSVAGSK
jgi:hypothetical protein